VWVERLRYSPDRPLIEITSRSNPHEVDAFNVGDLYLACKAAGTCQ
jgi:hypothetical protein